MGIATRNNDVVQFLNCTATHLNLVVKYNASGIVFHVKSDASYLSASKVYSRIGGHYYPYLLVKDNTKSTAIDPSLDGPLYVIYFTVKNVTSPIVEVEIGGLFVNRQEAIILHTTFEEIGHL